MCKNRVSNEMKEVWSRASTWILSYFIANGFWVATKHNELLRLVGNNFAVLLSITAFIIMQTICVLVILTELQIARMVKQRIATAILFLGVIIGITTAVAIHLSGNSQWGILFGYYMVACILSTLCTLKVPQKRK